MLAEASLVTGAKPGLRLLEADDARSLVARARSGDADAFHAIFDRFAKPVLGFIYNLLGNRAAAEELMQETFVRAYRRLPSVRDEALLGTWLFGIARNVVREAIKTKYREARRVALEGPVSHELEDGRRRPDQAVISAEVEAKVQQALSELSHDQRVVFVLKLFHRMSYEEIAEITGSSIGKLKTDLHRGRLEMKRRLRTYLGDGILGGE